MSSLDQTYQLFANAVKELRLGFDPEYLQQIQWMLHNHPTLLAEYVTLQMIHIKVTLERQQAHEKFVQMPIAGSA